MFTNSGISRFMKREIKYLTDVAVVRYIRLSQTSSQYQIAFSFQRRKSYTFSILYPAFLTASVILASSASPSTLRIFEGSFMSTLQLFSPTASFRCGVTVATQPEHFMFVLNFIVSIFHLF